MNTLTAAKAHLAKAQQFLQAAEQNHDAELYSAATSNAVTSGVNSKDAICLKLTGRTTKSEDHVAAAVELEAAGPAARPLANTFVRLLSKKSKAQYQTVDIAAAEAKRAIEQAMRLYTAAQQIVTS